MGYVLVAVIALLGCGKVNDDNKPIDAPSSSSPDAPNTCAGTTITECGADCRVCSVTSDRETPNCNGTSCGKECKAGAPSCTDTSCSRLVFAFDSGMLDGITARAPTGLQLSVRNHLGSQALAADVASLTEISFRIPICLSGTLDVRAKVFTMDVFFEGGDPNGKQYFAQVTVPDPSGALVGSQGVQAGTSFVFTGTIPSAATTQNATEILVQAGTFGAPFAGTIWFDNIRIQ